MESWNFMVHKNMAHMYAKHQLVSDEGFLILIWKKCTNYSRRSLSLLFFIRSSLV